MAPLVPLATPIIQTRLLGGGSHIRGRQKICTSLNTPGKYPSVGIL